MYLINENKKNNMFTNCDSADKLIRYISRHLRSDFLSTIFLARFLGTLPITTNRQPLRG
jgi:hypothetical protein